MHELVDRSPINVKMESPTAAAAAASSSSSSSAAAPAAAPPGEVPLLPSLTAAAWRRYQQYLDKAYPHVGRRWAGLGALAASYFLRVLLIQGFFIVTYGLGIYLTNLLIAFLSPLDDPDPSPSPSPLPVKDPDEFRPFVRRLPEFRFWYSITKAFCIAFILTFFSAFDVPVFWPILLFYWLVLFTMTMKRQILHMIKFKYVPYTIANKKRYTGKKVATRPATDEATIPLTSSHVEV